MFPLEKLTNNTKLSKQHLECKIRKTPILQIGGSALPLYLLVVGE